MRDSVVALTACSSKENLTYLEEDREHNEMSLVGGMGLIQSYRNVEELREEADLIIIGHATESIYNLEQIQQKMLGVDVLGEFWVDTPFEITKVIKGDYKENKIIIFQPVHIPSEDSPLAKDQVLTYSGYSPMLKRAQYMLFLVKSEFVIKEGSTHEYAWNIISLNHGKYNLDNRVQLEVNHSPENHGKLKSEIMKDYREQIASLNDN
jgi:hypothetical protein